MASVKLRGVLRHLSSLRDTQALMEAADADLLEWFTHEGGEAPFAALVRRHGPMVWSVARRQLGHVQDVEDVFQATFLILARKAKFIRKANSVGSWLHGVAHRLSLKVRVQQVRRQSREKRAADMRQNQERSDGSLDEARAALDRALDDLPEKYRVALVLYYLEGKTQEEAARCLGCPLATLRTRVARGRKLLRTRLAKNGLVLSSAGVVALLIASAAPAAAPAILAQTAIGAALRFAAGQSATTLCSKQAAGLVTAGLNALFYCKVKTTVVLLLAMSLVAGTAAALVAQGARNGGAATPAAHSATVPQASEERGKTNIPPAKDGRETITYGGRVLGPDSRPVAGAKLYLTLQMGYMHEPAPSPEYATTGADGCFTFKVAREKFANQYTVVTATAPNHGPDWIPIPAKGKRGNLTLRLVKDDAPIVGQVVDLEGRPVPGATLTVMQINAAPGEDIGPWIRAVKAREGRSLALEQKYLSRYTIALCPKATTGADGRFRLTGIGRNRLVRAQLDGPTIASQRVHIRTCSGEAITVTEFEGRPEYREPRRLATYYGVDFRIVAAPTRPIVGFVRDKDTKKPLAGVVVQSYFQGANNAFRQLNFVVRATTDAQGRYWLVGMPRGTGYRIVAIPGKDRPYLGTNKEVPDVPGLDPVTMDFDLKRGVWIEGKVTDKATGKPVRASVAYFSMFKNPNLRDYFGVGDSSLLFQNYSSTTKKEDGTYRLVGLPGPGLVAVWRVDNYLNALERDDEFATPGPSLNTAPFVITFPSNYAAIARIDPAKSADPIRRDVTLDAGWTFTGKLVGPDGKPLTGAVSWGTGMPWQENRDRMKESAEFTVRVFNPRRPRKVFFQHLERGLVGVAPAPRENGGTITVHMKPGAVVTGRLVDADGSPRPGITLKVFSRPSEEPGFTRYFPETVQTNTEGRFRVAVLLPGYEYRLTDGQGGLSFGSGLRLGETKDLGDVRMKAQ